MDMKKIIQIVDGTKSVLSESAVQECGQMGMQTQQPSMNINLNASGLSDIRDIINMLNAIEHGDQPSQVPPMPTPGMGVVPSIDVVANHDSEIEDKAKMDPLSKIKALAGLKADSDSSEPLEDDYANLPNPRVDTGDYSGGLSKKHQEFKKEYPGDNPMTKTVESDLRKLYNSIKESWDKYELDEISYKIPAEKYDDEPYYGSGTKTIEAEIPAPYDYIDDESGERVKAGESVVANIEIEGHDTDFQIIYVTAGQTEFDIDSAGEQWEQHVKEIIDDSAQEY